MDLMHKVFQSHLDLVVVMFIDDMLINSKSIEEHENHVKIVL